MEHGALNSVRIRMFYATCCVFHVAHHFSEVRLSAYRKEVGNYVPAPAVIRRPQALSGFIGRKARVGGLVRLWLKPTA